MVDATPLTLVVALAHMVDATSLTLVVEAFKNHADLAMAMAES